MKKIFLYGISFIVLFAIGFYFAESYEETLLTKRSQLLMGTVVEIRIKGLDENSADNLITKAFDEIKRVDNLFSSHNSSSSVWKINESSETIHVPPQDIFFVLQYCDSLTRLSQGAFDVSIGTLNNTWDFENPNPVIPTKVEIERAMSLSGWKNISLNPDGSIIKERGVQLNFGAVAKGYAVDKAIELLKRNGVTQALVNAGGEIREIGNDWVVGIQHPRSATNLLGTIKLNGMSVATSGDYEQFFGKDGKRYHHILNPETGYPSDKCRSVTVVAKTDMEADALATAVFVLGKDKGLELIENLNETEAMIVDSVGGLFYSSGFKNYLVE